MQMHTNDTSRVVDFPFTADAAYEAGTRVKMSGTHGQLTVAGDEACLGTLAYRTKGPGSEATLIAKPGTGATYVIGGGVIAAGASVTSAAGGKLVTGTAGAIDPGIALTACSGNGAEFLLLGSV
jgi:hypothetical protein